MSDQVVIRNGYKRSVSLAAVAATHEHYCDGAATALIQVHSSASATGARFSAEGRLVDDGPWVLCHIMPTNDMTPATPITETVVFSTVPIFGWRVDIQGFSSFRVRVTALTSGSFVINTKLSMHTYP